MAVFFDAAVEGFVMQSVIPRRKREIRTSRSQFALQLGKIAPKDEQLLLELSQGFRFGFETGV
jgi:hypothetical protein